MARTVPDRSSPPGPRAWIAATVTLAVVGRTFLGSARALAEIGRHARVSDPWALPIGLDGMAVVAAIARHHRRDDRWAQAALIVGVAVSTGLQVAAAPAGLANRITHGVPPIAAWLTFELFLRATDGVVAQARDDEETAPGQGAVGPATNATGGVPSVEGRASSLDEVEGEAPAASLRRATLADARRIDAGRQLSGRALERAIQDEGLAVARRRATEWATELARTAPDAPDGAPDEPGEPRHLEVAR